MSTPEEIHAIILTYPRDFYRDNNNLPYAGKRITKMLRKLRITKYGRFEYELRMTPRIYDPFKADFPYRCYENAARIVKENNLHKRYEKHIARIIAAAHMNGYRRAYELISCMPSVHFESKLDAAFKCKKIQQLLPSPIFEEIAPHI